MTVGYFQIIQRNKIGMRWNRKKRFNSHLAINQEKIFQFFLWTRKITRPQYCNFKHDLKLSLNVVALFFTPILINFSISYLGYYFMQNPELFFVRHYCNIIKLLRAKNRTLDYVTHYHVINLSQYGKLFSCTCQKFLMNEWNFLD